MSKNEAKAMFVAAHAYCDALATLHSLKSQGKYCPTEALSAAREAASEAFREHHKFIEKLRDRRAI